MYPPVVCITPFGFPVDPLVYNMKRGSSASISSGAQAESAEPRASCHHISLPSSILTAAPVRFTTNVFAIEGVFCNAISALLFIGISVFSPLTPVS